MLKLTKPIELPKTVKVEYSGGIFHFRIPTDLDKFDLLAASKTSERVKATFATLDKVENVVDEQDKPIPVDKLIDVLNLEQMVAIMMERNRLMAELEKTVEAETKN